MNNTIFNKSKEKILECFYNSLGKELYFSEILRLSKTTQNTTLKHLQNLQKQNIIIKNKKIANTFYKLNSKNPIVFSLLSYFNYKRLNKLSPEIKRAIIEFLGKLKIKPLILLVFGSTAKNSRTKKSDIDLLLIYNKKETQNNKLKKDIESTTGTKIQTSLFDYEYFQEQILKRQDNLLINAIKTGFVVSGNYEFYKEILK